jgi:hypothetical protein
LNADEHIIDKFLGKIGLVRKSKIRRPTLCYVPIGKRSFRLEEHTTKTWFRGSTVNHGDIINLGKGGEIEVHLGNQRNPKESFSTLCAHLKKEFGDVSVLLDLQTCAELISSSDSSPEMLHLLLVTTPWQSKCGLILANSLAHLILNHCLSDAQALQLIKHVLPNEN